MNLSRLLAASIGALPHTSSAIRRFVHHALVASFAMAATGAHAELVISTAPTSNVTCSGGTCTATAVDAVLNVVDLKTLLHHGNVQVASGAADTIAASATFSWTKASRLTLVAGTAIIVSQPIVVEGHGAVTLTTTADQSAGATAFIGRGRLDFWDVSSSLVINGQTYTLAGDVASLATAIAANTHGSFALAKSYDAKADALYTTSPVYVLYGSLNGLGHAISNVRIQSSENCAGFIAYLADGAAPTVSNLTLSQVGVTQTAFAKGNPVYGVGGLVGCSQGAVSHVRVTGRAKGGDDSVVGGIVGWLASGGSGPPMVADSSVQVAVSGGAASVLGGVAGWAYFSSIERCAAAGRIEGSGAAMAGGLVGNVSSSYPYGAIANNWSASRVSGAARAGGLVGEVDNWAALTSSYAMGGVPGGGGVTGNDDGTGVYASVYWDMDTSRVHNPAQGVYNIPNEPGITGLTDAQLKSGLPAGFDPAVWAQSASVNNGYPYLIANPPQ
jgi:hypothetical protein